jgi:gas vesicle protein
MRSRENLTNVLWFAAGVSLGATVGLLAAPASGSETRKYLSDRAGAAGEYLDYGRQLYEQGRDLADEAATLYEEGRHLVEG